MFGKLKLMLVKDLKSAIRARWYILVVEILLILIFIPAIWYSFASIKKNNQVYQYEQQEIDDFINSGTYDNGGSYDGRPKTLYYQIGTDDVDIEPIRNALSSMDINLTDFRLSYNYNNKYAGGVYANFTSVSYNPPKLYYNVIITTTRYTDIKSNYKFDPNMIGCDDDDGFCTASFSSSSDAKNTHFYINMAFLQATNSLKMNMSKISFYEIPATLFKNQDYSNNLSIWYTLLAVILFIPSIFSIKDVATEKENQIHVYMIVMGMKRYVYYMSHFIFATIKMWAFLLPAGAAIVVFINNGWWFYLNVIAFGHITVAWSMLASTLFVSGTYAMFTAVSFLGISMLIHYLIVNPYANIYIPGGALAASLLNPFSAYSFAETHTEILLNYDIPFRMFNSYPYYLPMIVPFISLIGQAIFYTLLTFYLDYVLPIDSSAKAHPFFFLGVKRKKEIMHHEDFEELDKNNAKKYGEYFEIESKGLADIEIVNLVKKWPNGEIAVKNASFKAYRGQVTALLGHNGAGKSTIFSCLTGFITPTSGQIIIGNEAENSRIGYCAQWDPLFPLLTAEEHLYFYGSLKTSSPILKSEVDEVLEQVDLIHARNTRGNALSGGMKRKLCVGMSMIGKSRILLLDEPTAGMDPMARRGVLDIIEKVKADKSVLLTTHYMDEADLLSDKIIIMAKGELICNGSSNFLKSKFGVGFVLTISVNTQQCTPPEYEHVAASVIQITQSHCHGAKIDGHVTAQFKIILPNGSQRQFPQLFSELEARKYELKIDSFGVGLNNLEQVFIKVTDMADPEESLGIKQKIEHFLDLRRNRMNGIQLFFHQCFALFARKWHYIRRHYIKSLIPAIILIPLLGLCIESVVTHNSGANDKHELDLDISKYPRMAVMGAWGYTGSQQERFAVQNRPGKILESPCTSPITNAIDNVLSGWKHVTYNSISNDNFRQRFYDSQTELPPLGFGFSTDIYGTVGFYTRNVLSGSGGLAIDAFTKAISTEPSSIITTLQTERIKDDYDDDAQKIFDSIYKIIVSILSSLIYPVIFSVPIFLYIAERHNGACHLYRLTKLSQFTYWLTAYITDMIVGLLYIIIILAMLFGFQVFQIKCIASYFAAIIAISFPLIFQGYFVSFFFGSPNMAFGVLNTYNVLVAFVFFGVQELVPKSIANTFDVVTNILFPLKSLIMVTFTMISECMFDINWDKDDPDNTGPSGAARIFATCDMSQTRPCSGWAVYGSLIMGAIYVALIIFVTMWRTLKLRTRPGKAAPSPGYPEDMDVIAERNFVESSPIEKFAVCTQNLRKRYSNNVVAVHNLSFGVQPGECFGLLGVNGAGKSTTFHMLTGVLTPSAGSGFVNHVRIDGQAKFGFCPQHNAVLEDLTVIEILLLFARLNGLKHGKVCVDILLDTLQIRHRSNNVVKNCSGGERRRLSIAVALITNCDVIILDEPTAGVDPRTRRHVWDILIAMRNVGTSQILSSHSMEECEALCTRVGFLNQGQLLGIGTSQHLKHRFGDKFILTLTLSSPNPDIINSLEEFVRQVFPLATRTSAFLATTVYWSLPKTQADLWSKIYHALVLLVDNWNYRNTNGCQIEDFALIESSLEQVFVSMARVPNIMNGQNA